MNSFEIDGDIRNASTPPSDFYRDPVWYERSLEAIFAGAWQIVCREDDVHGLFPHTLLEGSLDEPVLLTNDSGRINCVSNVCTHRGMVLVDQPCKADIIRCGYHGRRFELDGSFLSMPEFGDAENFPRPEDDLAKVPFATWNGFVFAGADPDFELEDLLSPLSEASKGFPYGGLRFAGSRTYEFEAHWALYCENFLEGFHIPYVHPELSRVIEFSSYRTDLFARSSLQTGRGSQGADGSPPFVGGLEAFYYFIFPNTMLNLYPWGISVNIVLPQGPARTKVRYLTYVCDESKAGAGAGGDLDKVELQDQAVVRSVQRGIRSRFYDRGRYSPSRETGVHHFHRLLASALGEGG